MLFRVQVQGPGSGFRSSRDRIGKDYSHSCESEKIGWSFEVKRRSENFDQKKTYQSWKTHCCIDFAEYLIKSDVSENSKVNYDQFLRNRLHERHWYVSKSRRNVQYLEVC